MKKIFPLLFIFVFLIPPIAHAQTSNNTCPNGTLNSNGTCNLTYTPLEPIPGATSNSNGTSVDFPTLLKNMFTILFTIGALFSVLMLTLSGVRYMLSDVVTDKERAKKRITACIYGLLLLAGSWLILNTINPQLLNFTLIPCAAGETGCTIAGTVTTSNATPAASVNVINNAQVILPNQSVTVSPTQPNAAALTTLQNNCGATGNGLVDPTAVSGNSTTYNCITYASAGQYGPGGGL